MKNILLITFLLQSLSSLAQNPWINEIHYDNDAIDVDEGIEIAGSAGTDLDCYDLVFYNGNDNLLYMTQAMTGTIPDDGCGYGTFWFPITGIQNGGSDGMALVYDPSNAGCSSGGSMSVLMFISYEGTLTASNGPASGMTSTDIGVFETSTSTTGYSLQLNGTGTSYTDFTWSGSALATNGSLNTTQTIDPCTSTTITTGAVSSPSFNVDCTNGTTGAIAFTSLGDFNPGNEFIVELSSDFGDFTFPLEIGTLALDGTNPSGNITFTIPAGFNTGTGYRLRIISTDPATIAGNDNGIDITITNTDGTCTDPMDICAQIIQIQIDPEGGANGTLNDTGEFIQICNVCDSDIDISCFVLCFTEDDGGARRGDCIRIPDGTILTAGECYLMGGNGTTGAGADWSTTLDLNWHTCGCVVDVDGSGPGEYVGVLTDGGEDITLFNADGDVISAITFAATGGANYEQNVAVSASGSCDGLWVTIPESGDHTDVGSSPGASTDDEGWVFDCLSQTWIFANHDNGDGFMDLDPDMLFSCDLIDPLPIELMNFGAKSLDYSNLIYWSTNSEFENDYFFLERSIDAVHFDRIAVIDAAGNSSIHLDYNYTDLYPENISYYKLTQVDFDGDQKTYGPIIHVRKLDELHIFPNPANSSETIHISGGTDGFLTIREGSGKIVFQSEYFSDQTTKVDGLNPGIYFVENNSLVFKLIVR